MGMIRVSNTFFLLTLRYWHGHGLKTGGSSQVDKLEYRSGQDIFSPVNGSTVSRTWGALHQKPCL